MRPRQTVFTYLVHQTCKPSFFRNSSSASRHGLLIRRLGNALAAIFTGALLSACASANLPERSILAVQRPEPPAPRDTISGNAQAFAASSVSEMPEPTGPLTLNQAIALTMERNPELAAYAWDSKGALARLRQARLWPNPELEYERENFGGTGELAGATSAETTISLAQALPLGGDIRRRRELAALESDLADWDYHATRVDALLEVTQRFVVALAADRRLDLAKRELERIKSVERVTSGKVEAGDVSPIELDRVLVPVVTTELSLDRAERIREAAYRRLSLSWGAKEVTFQNIAGNLENLSPLPNPEDLIRRINDNPAVARWTTEISARIAEGQLAKAEAIPDLHARLGYRESNASDDEAFVVGVSLPLPLFDRNQGDISVARAGEAAAANRKRAAELRIEGLLSSAYAQLADAHNEAVALRDRALPAADRAYQATQQSFKEGKLPFLDVLNAQQTLFDLQNRYLESLVTYHSTTAEIDALVGRPILSNSP